MNQAENKGVADQDFDGLWSGGGLDNNGSRQEPVVMTAWEDQDTSQVIMPMMMIRFKYIIR